MPGLEAMIKSMEKCLGLREPNKIQEWYRKRNGAAYNYNFPWCNATITWAAVDSGNYAEVCFGTDYAYTVAHAARFQAKGQWHPMNKGIAGTGIRRGDIVFFDWDGSWSIGKIDHVGIVTSVKGGIVYTIEGNTANVCARRARSVGEIAGFGRPNYKTTSTKPSTSSSSGLGVKGIDIASYQSETPKLDGFDFVCVKATEGTTYVNPRHDAQVAHAREGKRVVGHYHFLRDGSMKKQIDYFLKHAKAQADEFLMLDWEDGKVSDAEKNEALTYCQSKAGGRKVLLYCNTNFWLNKDKHSECGDGLWIAHYGVGPGKPKIQHKWLIHQYTDDPIDTNVTRWKTRAEMAKWAASGKAPAKKAPAKKPAKPKPPKFPGRQYFVLGAKNAHAKQLQQWLHKGNWGPRYLIGPSTKMTRKDLAKVAALQRHYLKDLGPADGLTGPKTWQYAFEVANGLRKK